MTSISAEQVVIPTRAAPARLALRAGIALLVLCGLAFRAAPLLDREGRLLRQFPTEDAYLMLTIARNVAIGSGMSTAEGTLPTNGTQPAITFLWAAGYKLVNGDKVLGVALTQVAEIVIGLCAAFMLYRLGRRLLAHRADGASIAALAAGLWYAAPLTVENGQNCLETGPYAAIVLLAALAYLSAWQSGGQRWSAVRCLTLGLVSGACFWVRNDAALLVFAACLVRLLSGLRGERGLLARRLYESTLMGLAALCIASPWMVYNTTRFGHIMPISGIAEGMDATFAGNLGVVAPKLAEFIAVVAAVPRRIERQPLVLAGCLAVLACFLVMALLTWRRAAPAARATLAVMGIFALLLAGFYGLFFGAGYFMSRYLFPISAFLALTTVTGLWEFWRWVGPGRLRSAGTVLAAVTALGMMLGLNARGYAKGKTHMHFQVVEWVDANVPKDAWVAATQTGTLGYFHDRTINLDGKVNPEALRARLSPGQPDGIPQYILDKKVAYLADWAGITTWMKRPLIAGHFEMIVDDPARGEFGLGVLKRVRYD